MKKSAFILLCVLILLMSVVSLSCEKEKPADTENTDIPLIEKVVSGDEVYMVYSYNDANLVTEEKSRFHYTRHSYNNKKQLTKSDFYFDMSMVSSNSRVIEAAMKRKEWVNPGNTERSLTKTYKYKDTEERIEVLFDRNSDDKSDFLVYIIENEKIIKSVMYRYNVMSSFIDYRYDQKGNLILETKYRITDNGDTELLTTTEYEYDNMNNPWRSFKRLMTPGKYTNQNNIIRSTYKIHFDVDQFIEKVQVTDYSYDYNRKGYPVRENDARYVYR